MTVIGRSAVAKRRSWTNVGKNITRGFKALWAPWHRACMCLLIDASILLLDVDATLFDQGLQAFVRLPCRDGFDDRGCYATRRHARS